MAVHTHRQRDESRPSILLSAGALTGAARAARFTGRPQHQRATAVLLAVMLCGAGCQADAQARPHQARGLIANVQARSIAETEGITLRADDGRELSIRVDPSVDVTPGHLREHMTLGQ